MTYVHPAVGGMNVSQNRNLTLDILPMTEKYYVYILRCNDGKKYYGSTNNLAKRFDNHRKGYVTSTKQRRPVELIYFEEFDNRSEAFKRELQLKSGRTRKEMIEKLIDNFQRQNVKG